MKSYVLAIDQGTTSSRAILFDETHRVAAVDQMEFAQHFPASGHVEHCGEDIWRTVVETCHNAIAKLGIEPRQIAGIGITNQRETTILWDRRTGKPVHRAIVWQDRRTSDYCAELKAQGHEAMVSEKTGLLLDPYFSATKVRWMLENVEGLKARAQDGDILFGTIDTYLLWRLTGGASHKTDATNASRTMLYNIQNNSWDSDLQHLFGIPAAILPHVEDCAADFGHTDPVLFGASIPVLGIAGDQQAALLGQACFAPGMVKSTYGTGCFAMINTGTDPVASQNRLLTTISYQLNGTTNYALEGSIFIAGAAVQWLRDGLKIIEHAAQTEDLARQADDSHNVILVPAFAGLGAPYWQPDARGALFGLTRATGPKELARAALEAVCFQTRDLIEAMHNDWPGGTSQTTLRVDGGMVANDWVMQKLADILNAPIDRPEILETTALGAAWLAGMKAGVWPDQQGFAKSWRLQKRFTPALDAATREQRYKEWRSAVASTIGHHAP